MSAREIAEDEFEFQRRRWSGILLIGLFLIGFLRRRWRTLDA